MPRKVQHLFQTDSIYLGKLQSLGDPRMLQSVGRDFTPIFLPRFGTICKMPLPVRWPIPLLAQSMFVNSDPSPVLLTSSQAPIAVLVDSGKVRVSFSVRPFPRTATVLASRSTSSIFRALTYPRHRPELKSSSTIARSRLAFRLTPQDRCSRSSK